MTTFYCLDAETSGVVASLGVNDAPLVLDTEATGVRTVRTVNEWLLPEGNRLSVSLAWPPDVPYEAGRARVAASVYAADPRSEVPKPESMLARFNWPPSGVGEAYPVVSEYRFRVADPPPTRVWTEAEPVKKINGEDRLAILELVTQFRRTLMGGDFEGACRMTEYKLAEDARANGIDPFKLRESVLDQYEMVLGSAIPESEPLTSEKMVLRPVGNGNVLLVARDDQSEAVILETDKRFLMVPVYVARIEGEWKIVR